MLYYKEMTPKKIKSYFSSSQLKCQALKETWEFSGIKILLLKINQRIHIPRSSVELRFQEKVPEVLGRLFAQGHQTRLSPWDSAPWF